MGDCAKLGRRRVLDGSYFVDDPSDVGIQALGSGGKLGSVGGP